jgi:hypothetical protein
VNGVGLYVSTRPGGAALPIVQSVAAAGIFSRTVNTQRLDQFFGATILPGENAENNKIAHF